ncbi:MAG: 23S rRNA pseudouridylate synthase B, partial [Porticoccaceae bacterium]|nr:23S rRNA pseudouridylate synthase B [Porticoccaceae bacterium]
NREVRRLWESQGVEVNRLKRVRFGPIFFPSYLREGQWIDLEPQDIKALCHQAGIDKVRIASLTPQERKKRQRQEERLRAKGRNN